MAYYQIYWRRSARWLLWVWIFTFVYFLGVSTGVFNILFKQDRQCTYKRNIGALWRNHCCCVNAINMFYSECLSVVVLIQRAMRMRCIILILVASPIVTYFFTLSHKWHDCRENVTIQKMCYHFLYNLLLKRFILFEELRQTLSKISLGFHVKYL
jgi:hypothetical protein